MKTRHPHPNEPGVWTLIDHDDAGAIWRRERVDPTPLTSFCILRPPRQTEIVYSEERAREAFGRSDVRPSARSPEQTPAD